MKRLKPLLLFFLVIPFLTKAQDPSFTQIFETPMYYNPAFAGFQENFRTGLQLRLQPLVGNAYVTVAASADVGMPKINSGAGIMFTSSSYGFYTSTTIGGFYAYQIKLNTNSFLRLGINAGLFQRAYDYGVIDTLSAKNAPNAVQATPFIPNFGVGALYYNDKVYLGLAVYNLTQPDQSIDGVLDPNATLYRRYDLQFGGFFKASGILLNPNLLVVSQGTFFQALPGISASIGAFTLGTAVRIQANPNVESLNLLFGFTGAKVKFCYSYDLSLFNTGLSEGVHELTLILQMNKPHDTTEKPMIGFMRGAY